MDVLHLTRRVLRGGLIGGIAATIGCFILLEVYGLTFGGFDGLRMGFYYAALFLYIFPVGMLLGAMVAIFSEVRKSAPRIGGMSTAWIGLLLLILAAVVIMQQMIGEERMIRHSASWRIDSSARTDCTIPVVLLQLVEYAHYEAVCSAQLYAALENETSEIIPITYHVTYDFGRVRDYSLSSVGAVDVHSQSDWIRGGGNCGRNVQTCARLLTKNDRMLYESSWVGE